MRDRNAGSYSQSFGRSNPIYWRPDPNWVYEDGNTLLHHLLLSHYSSGIARDDDLWHAVRILAQFSNGERSTLLGKTNSNGDTPLRVLLDSKHIPEQDKILLGYHLIELGADPSTLDQAGYTWSGHLSLHIRKIHSCVEPLEFISTLEHLIDRLSSGDRGKSGKLWSLLINQGSLLFYIKDFNFLRCLLLVNDELPPLVIEQLLEKTLPGHFDAKMFARSWSLFSVFIFFNEGVPRDVDVKMDKIVLYACPETGNFKYKGRSSNGFIIDGSIPGLNKENFRFSGSYEDEKTILERMLYQENFENSDISIPIMSTLRKQFDLSERFNSKRYIRPKDSDFFSFFKSDFLGGLNGLRISERCLAMILYAYQKPNSHLADIIEGVKHAAAVLTADQSDKLDRSYESLFRL